jgi:hypothetical protein
LFIIDLIVNSMSNFIGFWMRERGRKAERDGFNGVSIIRMLVKDMNPAALERERVVI